MVVLHKPLVELLLVRSDSSLEVADTLVVAPLEVVATVTEDPYL